MCAGWLSLVHVTVSISRAKSHFDCHINITFICGGASVSEGWTVESAHFMHELKAFKGF